MIVDRAWPAKTVNASAARALPCAMENAWTPAAIPTTVVDAIRIVVLENARTVSVRPAAAIGATPPANPTTPQDWPVSLDRVAPIPSIAASISAMSAAWSVAATSSVRPCRDASTIAPLAAAIAVPATIAPTTKNAWMISPAWTASIAWLPRAGGRPEPWSADCQSAVRPGWQRANGDCG